MKYITVNDLATATSSVAVAAGVAERRAKRSKGESKKSAANYAKKLWRLYGKLSAGIGPGLYVPAIKR